MLLQERADEIVIGDGIAEPERHGGNLGIEDRAGRAADQAVEDLHVLARRMEHLHAGVLCDELQQRADIEILGQRVDQTFHTGRGGLDQAELRPVGGLAVKLRVQADEIALCELGAEGFEMVLVGDRGKTDLRHSAGLAETGPEIEPVTGIC